MQDKRSCLEAALARTGRDRESPDNTSLLANLAGLFSTAAGRLSEAALYYEESVANSGAVPLPLLALADTRSRLCEAESALACLAKAESMARSASDPDVLKMIANIRADWERDG